MTGEPVKPGGIIVWQPRAGLCNLPPHNGAWNVTLESADPGLTILDGRGLARYGICVLTYQTFVVAFVK